MTTSSKSVSYLRRLALQGKVDGSCCYWEANRTVTYSFKHSLKHQDELFCCLLSCMIERNLRSNAVTKSNSWLEKSELYDLAFRNKVQSSKYPFPPIFSMKLPSLPSPVVSLHHSYSPLDYWNYQLCKRKLLETGINWMIRLKTHPEG